MVGNGTAEAKCDRNVGIDKRLMGGNVALVDDLVRSTTIRLHLPATANGNIVTVHTCGPGKGNSKLAKTQAHHQPPQQPAAKNSAASQIAFLIFRQWSCSCLAGGQDHDRQ